MTLSPVLARPAVASRAQLNPRNNSLNAIRLVLAACVLVSHSFTITGHPPEPTVSGQSLGGWAVVGFFALSGYLITGSRERNPFGHFLTSRVARIFPAFLVCLIVVAFVFAPIAYRFEHGSLGGFFTSGNTPANFVFQNMGLKIFDYSVSETLTTVPHPRSWNGALWSLWYEFLCYIAIALLAFASWRHRRIDSRVYASLTAALFIACTFAYANIETTLTYFSGNLDVALILKMIPYFLGGSLIYFFRNFIPFNIPVGVLAGVLFCLIVWANPVWGSQAAAPLMAIFLLSVGRVVPSPQWIQRNDISYGLYIYAFPVQQIFVLFGLSQHVWLHIAVSLMVTVVFAMASWFFLESPVLRAVRR